MVRLGFKQTEVGEIPEDWDTFTLADLCHANGLVRGPFGGALKKEIFTSSGYTVYEQRHAISGSTDVSRYFVNKAKYDELSRFQVQPGDLIVSCSGTIGKILRISEQAPKGIINQALLKITLRDNVSSDYFVSLFKSPYIQEKIVDSSHGGAMPNLVGMEDFKKTPFQMPRFDEQKAIAKALSDVDELIVSLEKLIAKKRDIKTATMQQLLTGKTRLPGFGEGKGYKITELGEIPEDWDVLKFDEIAFVRKNRVNPKIAGGGQLCIELENIEQNTGTLNGISVTTSNSSIKNVFDVGNILFGKLRSYLRKYWFSDFSGVCSTEIWVLNAIIGKSIPQFLYQLVQTDRFIECTSEAYGTHMPRADWSVVKEFVVAMPNVLEQENIATVLSSMDQEINSLELQLNKTKSLKQGMMQELLTGRTRLVDVSTHQVEQERKHGT
jgi:type I restriction enzyme S subunit